jgi:flagellar basal body P-ring formation protein FlgA
MRMERSKQTQKPNAAAAVAVLVLVLLAAATAAGSTGRISVRVYDQVEITADQIQLGKIARIDGDDAGLVRELEALVIGRSPLPGKSRSLDSAAILLRLKQSGIDLARIELQIPPEVQVSRGAVEVGRERIEQIVTAFIQQQFAGKGQTVRIKEIRGAEPVLLPKGSLSHQVAAPRNSALSGSMPLTVTLKVNDEIEKRMMVTAVVEVLVNAVVTTRPLGRFKPIEESDVEVRPVDVSGLPSDYIADPEVVLGKRTRRLLDANTVLRPDLVESQPIVKRGDRVRIIVESPGMRITAVGEVKQNGCLGERIPVANLDTNKVIQARVVDPQTVKIDF